jgi:hypothetical protein
VEDTGEGSDAWQAAQNILNAINFGELTKMSEDEGPQEGEKGAHSATGKESSPAHPPVAAKTNVSSANPSSSVFVPGNNGEERAELQAHLALLAAQLAEIGEDTFTRDFGSFGDDDGDGEDDDETMEVVNV